MGKHRSNTNELTGAHISFTFDRHLPPALTIHSGDLIEVKTLDARGGQVLLGQGDHATSSEKANPVTGPIAVVDAAPGDTLAVHIKKIEVAAKGYTRTRPAHGVLAGYIQKPRTILLPIEGGQAIFADNIKLSLQPMIGTIGVAPAGKPVPTLWAGLHGGNMDHNGVRAGGTVYLPVFVPGALLSLGDGHALMGDGELTGTGLEVATTTTIQVELFKNLDISRPWVRYDDRFSAVGFGPTADAATSDAALALTELLARHHNLAFADAYLLMGLIGDGALCQACQHPHVPAIVRIEVPCSYVEPWP